jgi:hypothetical protein
MEYLLGPCWEIEQDGQGNSGRKDLYKHWIGEEKNQMVYKGKIDFFPVFEHHAMNIYEGVEVQLHSVLTSALSGGEWSVSGAGYFHHGERAMVPDDILSAVTKPWSRYRLGSQHA